MRRIVERCCELSIEAAKLALDSPERKKLEDRQSALDSYTFPRLYEANQETRNELVLNFVRARVSADPYAKGGPGTWDQLREEADKFKARIEKRPARRPIDIRRRVTEALELRIEKPRKPWNRIAKECGFEEPDRLRNEITKLRALLRQEGIQDPSQE